MITNFTAADVPDQSGKISFITGANAGIGFETAKLFAEKGGRVLLGCRNEVKANNAVARIIADHPNANVEFVHLDLSDLASVEKAAEIVANEPKLDVLVNNAGIMATNRTLTAQGFESQFGVNHLGHFALTARLLPLLEATPDSRIVNIASVGHRYGIKDLFWDDIDGVQHYSPSQRYYASKLANVMFTYELDRRLRAKCSSTIAVAAHPGGAVSELNVNTPGLYGVFTRAFRRFGRPIMNSSAQGAWPTELAATAPGVEGGQYFGPCRFNETSGPAQQVDSIPESKDPEKWKRLWDLSIEMTGIDPGI